MEYDIFLVLGCYGLRIEDFVDCPGVENIILKIHPGLSNYSKLMEYLDRMRLFDKPLFDYNGIRHTIFHIYENYDEVIKPIWTKQKYEMYQKFHLEHRYCGTWLKLSLPEIQEELVSETENSKLRLIK